MGKMYWDSARFHNHFSCRCTIEHLYTVEEESVLFGIIPVIIPIEQNVLVFVYYTVYRKIEYILLHILHKVSQKVFGHNLFIFFTKRS